MNRRDFVLRTLGGLALAAIPAPLLARGAPNAVATSVDTPIGEKVDYRLTEDVLLAQLHQDFPQYAFWMTPLVYDPHSFVAYHGLLFCGPVTGGRPAKLKARFSGDFVDDVRCLHGLNADDELYAVMRDEIARELEHKSLLAGGLDFEYHGKVQYTFPFYT